MSNPEATLCAFVYDERPTLNLTRSLLREARCWPELLIMDHSKDALISRARSYIATYYLEQGAGDVLVMVDHDIGWEAGDLHHLVQVCLDQKGVVGGVFSKRGFQDGVPIRFGQYGEYTVPSDRIVECLSVATGFMAIHRSVLETMAGTLPMTVHGFRNFFETATVAREDGRLEYLSEDYAFCDKARALGFRVWADLRPQLTHYGSHMFTVHDTAWKPPARDKPATIRAIDTDRPLAIGERQVYVDPDDRYVSASLIRGESWEHEVIEAISAEAKPTDTILEIGAHIGWHAVNLAPLVERYVAVEPLPHLAKLLRKNADLSTAEIDIWEAAVVAGDDRRKRVRMLRPPGNPGASYLVPPDSDAGQQVTAVRLADLGPFDILKLDAEGAEHLILNGADLGRCRFLVTEYCPEQLMRVSGVTGAEYLALLDSLGFDATADLDVDALPQGSAYCNLSMRRKP